MSWKKITPQKNPILQLAELTLRLQRVVLIDKLYVFNSMLATHTRTLQKHPKSAQALVTVRKHFYALQTTLKKELKAHVH